MDPRDLRQLLNRLQIQFEITPMPPSDKLKALRALSGLAGYAEMEGESPQVYAWVGELLALSDSVPLAKSLVQHYPVLAAPNIGRSETGWGAL